MIELKPLGVIPLLLSPLQLASIKLATFLPILNISGAVGLVHDEAGGIMSNIRDIPATTVDYLGNIINTLVNEVRFHRARRVDHADGMMYNAGVLGVEYFNTEADGTTLISPQPFILNEGPGENFCFPSDVPSTQIITLVAGNYTIWLDDTDDLGTINLSGGATGTVLSTDVEGLTFTSSGAAITFTHSGSNNIRWQVESGNYKTSYIPTTISSAVRTQDRITIPHVAGINLNQSKIIILLRFTPEYDQQSGNDRLFGLGTGLGFIYDSTVQNQLRTFDGTSAVLRSTSGWNKGDDVIIALIASAATNSRSLAASYNGGSTWTTWAAGGYDGGFNIASTFEVFSNNKYPNKLRALHVYGDLIDDSVVSTRDWVITNAANLT